ncbi:hypothetical protein ACI2TR_24585, partial [Ralstonia nicotianae]
LFVGKPVDDASYPREIGNAPAKLVLAKACWSPAKLIHVKSVTRTREIGNAQHVKSVTKNGT